MKRIAMLAVALAVSGPGFTHEEDAACDCAGGRASWNWSPHGYGGGGLGSASFDRDWSTVQQANDTSYVSQARDDKDTSFAVFGGVEFLKYLALEAGYSDFGEVSFAAQSDGSGSFFNAGPVTESMAVTATSLSALVRIPLIARSSLVLRGGAQHWRRETTVRADLQGSGPFANDDQHAGTDLLYGGGLDFDPLPSLRLRASYTRSSVENWSEAEISVTSMEASVAYRF